MTRAVCSDAAVAELFLRSVTVTRRPALAALSQNGSGRTTLGELYRTSLFPSHPFSPPLLGSQKPRMSLLTVHRDTTFKSGQRKYLQTWQLPGFCTSSRALADPRTSVLWVTAAVGDNHSQRQEEIPQRGENTAVQSRLTRREHYGRNK